MPHIDINGAKLYYEDFGKGEETIFLSHGLLFSGRMYQHQIDYFKDRYRCITLDFRGQGKSQVTASGYDMDTLTEDVVGLMDALGLPPCHFVGLSMGGFVGMRLGIRHPDRLKSLTIMNSSAEPEPSENVPKYKRLSMVASWIGLRWVVGKVMPIVFADVFLKDPVRAKVRKHWRKAISASNSVGITRAVDGVIYREAVIDGLHRIKTPTLIVAGEKDTATIPAKSERIHQKIKGSQMRTIARAGHSSVIEEPEAVNHALDAFFMELSK